MRILTVRQPWASLIIAGEKRIENRSWRPPATTRIGIHAAARPEAGVELTTRDLRDLGVVLGTVFVTSWHGALSDGCDEHGCYEHEYAYTERWRSGNLWHWVLAAPHRYATPIRARGALGLWEPGPSLEHLMTIAEEATS